MKIREYFIKHLLFPRLIKLSYPGIIIHEASVRFSPVKKKKRFVFLFEDLFVHIQKITTERLGEEECSEIWSQIGLEIGNYYLAGVTIPDFIKKSAVRHILSGFASAGGSCLKHIDIDDGQVRARGKNNVICRKTGISAFNDSVMKSILGNVTGKIYRCHGTCTRGTSECIFSYVETDKEYQSEPLEDIPADFTPPQPRGLPSFSDFLQFGKININEGKHLLFNKVCILPSWLGVLYTIEKHYDRHQDILKDAAKATVSLISEDLFDSDNLSIRTKRLEAILSVMGLGICTSSSKQSSLFLSIDSPIQKHESLYLTLIITLYSHATYNDLVVNKISTGKNNLSIELQIKDK